jgi:hypothetical protein
VYVVIQKIIRMAEEAAASRPPRFDPRPRLAQELQRLLADVSDDALPGHLRSALRTGVVVGPNAADWLPHLRTWLDAECRRTSLNPGGD